MSSSAVLGFPWAPGNSICVTGLERATDMVLLWKQYRARCKRIREGKKYRKVDYNRRVV